MEGFGQRLKEERERLGMSQVEFATACGVKRTAQYNYEANERHPDIVYLGGAMAAGVDMGYLLTGSRDLAKKLYAASFVANRAGEHLVLEALANLDLDGFVDSIGSADMDSARARDRGPILRKLIAHNRDLRAIFEARPAVDVKLLEAVLREIERSDLAKALPAGQRAKVTALAYRAAAKNGAVDRELIAEAAGLVAPT